MGFYHTIRFLFVPAVKIVFPFKAFGRENVPKDSNFLLCCNHISYIDPVYHIIALRQKVHFMARDNIFKNKFFGWFLKKMGAYAVKRGSSDTESIKMTFNLLKNGENIGIFPEGTRSKDGVIGKGKAGAALVAFKSGISLVPAAIYTKGGRVKAFHKTTVVYGKPVTIQELGMQTGNSLELKESTRKLMALIEELQEKAKVL